MLKKWQITALEKIPGWIDFVEELSSSAENKKLLLEMARNGEPRPSCKLNKLGGCLVEYTNKNKGSYDPEFDKQIRKLRPDWFTNTADKNKEQLLEMARNGKPRPSFKTKLYGRLFGYVNKNNGSYDPEFDKQIRKLRPDWLENTADKNKEQLLEMARNGKPRPNKPNKLGVVLCSYTNKNSGSYDPEFTAKIRELRLDWFVSKSDIADEKKERLLEMARNGEPRPNKHNKLGVALCSYTTSGQSAYDSEFDIKVRNLRPDWFANTANENKELLLERAAKGESRPSQCTKLGACLCNYVNKNNNCYDLEFDVKIRKLRLDWFVSQSDIVKEKKERLLKMARNGESKPNWKTKLGLVLGKYTNKKSNTYDPEFDTKIRKLAPHWFRK
jgi:hypothetical protein